MCVRVESLLCFALFGVFPCGGGGRGDTIVAE
jgi:hypothetical protein